MKIFKRVAGGLAALSLVTGLAGPIIVHAATTPSLGQAVTYGVLADTYTNTAPSTVNGDIGFTTGPAVVPAGIHTNYGVAAPYAQAGIDQATALNALNIQPCTFNFAPGPIDLSTDITHGPVTVYTPGVYCSTGAMNISGPLTLNGAGTYIFRPDGALTSDAGSIITLTDASACDVFWTPTAATTLGANTTFFGSVIQPDSSAITVGAVTTWTGRALAFGGTVTTAVDDIISVPVCAAPVPAPSSNRGAITVVKNVINDNGRTLTVDDFSLFVNGTPVIAGMTNEYQASAQNYVITETANPNYTTTFSGDCDSLGTLLLNRGDRKVCVVTNNDIGAPVVVPPVPPLIDVVKVPDPLALPAGPGQVTYTYTLKNIGTVPVTDITMVGDTCSPVVLAAGDTNSDAVLQVDETWKYTCSATLTETHTNTVTAIGWANGISTTDLASATVVVGSPVIPPLIHVTKVPNPLALGVGGGMVTYTEKITNPGTVALSNVTLVDDKCSPMQYVSGDVNGDYMLAPTETFTYTCTTNLTDTTTNTAIASGTANGMTVRDLAVATVVVAAAVPGLPNTGLSLAGNLAALMIAVSSLIAASLLLYANRKKLMA